jgi:hypothetical protein
VDLYIFRRRKQLRQLPPSDVGDIYLGCAVRLAWGSGMGWVKWIDWLHGTAGVHWEHQEPGRSSIEKIKFLRPAAANPAFGPDVREGS